MDNSLNKIIPKLSKSEKQFISSFFNAFSHSTDDFLILYNHLNKSGIININELKNEIKDENFFKYISVKKEILLENILKSLINHHFEDDIHWKIQRDILYIKILIEKNLIDKAKKIIKRAKKISYRYEEFDLLINILELEESICFKHSFISDVNKFYDIKKERNNIIEIYENLKEFLKIKAELQHFQFSEDTYTSDLSNFVNTFGYNPTSLEFEPKSIKAQSILLYIQGISYYIQHNYDTSLYYNTKLYELYQKHTNFFSRFEYLQLMSNYIYCSCLTQNEELCNKLMKEYKNIPNQTKEESMFINLYCYCRELELFHRLAKFKEAEQIAFDAEQYYEQIKFYAAHLENLSLHFYIIRAHIENGNYENALKSFQKKFNSIGDDYYSSLFKLFEFISHYKLGNYEYLLYAVNSWSKTVKLKRKQFPIEKVLIKFFRSLCNNYSIISRKKLISNAIVQLKELEKSKSKYYINHYFDFAAWFERELEEMK